MSTPYLAESETATDIVQLSINTIRTLSIDAVERAKSGHPGTPMALAPLVYTLWNRVMSSIHRTLSGPIATGLCCPMAMRQCCSGQCCT